MDALLAVVVAGPTASGKSALALSLAVKLEGEIVSYDSVQLYRDFDLGSAKPSAAELAQVRHHFIGEADPRHPWTAGMYARQARARMEEIGRRGRMVVLVGGTGFYLRALLEGLSDAPASPPALRARLKARLERQGPERLHRLLARLDPASAMRIAPRDGSKALRALEVRMLARRPVEQVWASAPPQPFAGLQTLRFGLAPPRAALYSRIDRRAQAMFAPGGIVDETRRLLAIYPPELRIFQSHGYKQACDILQYGASPAAALAEAQQEQRNYAKRQWTWFRRDPEMVWLQGFGDEAEVQAQAWKRVRAAGWCPTTGARR